MSIENIVDSAPKKLTGKNIDKLKLGRLSEGRCVLQRTT